MAKKSKSMTNPMAATIQSDGTTRDTAMPPVVRKAMVAAVKTRAKVKKPYVGGGPPVPPDAAETPLAPRKPIQTHTAIGQRPVMPKTAAKMARMKKGY